MKRKEVEDVMGGKDAWANVDKTDGKLLASWLVLFLTILLALLNVPGTDAMVHKLSFTKFKSEVRTSR